MNPVQQDVEWLVDSGAEIGAVQWSLGLMFDTNPQRAIGVQGRTGVDVVTGIGVSLEASDQFGRPIKVVSSKRTAIWKNDRSSNIVGMEQLAEMGACLVWSPSRSQGYLAI